MNLLLYSPNYGKHSSLNNIFWYTRSRITGFLYLHNSWNIHLECSCPDIKKNEWIACITFEMGSTAWLALKTDSDSPCHYHNKNSRIFWVYMSMLQQPNNSQLKNLKWQFEGNIVFSTKQWHLGQALINLLV